VAVKLRFVSFNVENLFLLVDLDDEAEVRRRIEQGTDFEWQLLTTSPTQNKGLPQLKALAREIEFMQADVLMLCEVGGRESLENFNKYFLNDAYVPYLIEGNSERGIDLGYLVRKTLPFKYDLISHKNRPIDFLYPHERPQVNAAQATFDLGEPAKVLTSHRFSRDVLELRLFGESDALKCICLTVHLKSQLDPLGIDPFGRDRRRAELEKLVHIYQEIEAETKGAVPILVSGDFNGIAAEDGREPEFEGLAKTKLRDALSVAQTQPEERFTHMQISPYSSKSDNRQFDYIFLSPPAQAALIASGTYVHRYRSLTGGVMAIPRSLTEKRALPSDHYPVIAELEI
jgi:hypothetical protein